jgi:hypothetical protein
MALFQPWLNEPKYFWAFGASNGLQNKIREGTHLGFFSVALASVRAFHQDDWEPNAQRKLRGYHEQALTGVSQRQRAFPWGAGEYRDAPCAGSFIAWPTG